MITSRPTLLTAVANGILNDLGCKPSLGQLRAHQRSTLTAMIAFGLLITLVLRGGEIIFLWGTGVAHPTPLTFRTPPFLLLQLNRRGRFACATASERGCLVIPPL